MNNILVTGAKGFVGKNLVAELKNKGYENIFEYDIDTDKALLDEYCKKAEFVFHLAGVNRPKDVSEFEKGNFGFTSILLETLKKYNNTCPVMISSSTQAALDNPYGISKKAGEELLKQYSAETGAVVYIFRFTNLFGKWSRPNYNSAVATFCHNIAHGLDITVNDENAKVRLAYIDDVVKTLIGLINGISPETENGFYTVKPDYTVTLGEITSLLYSFKESRKTLSVPNMQNEFEKKLYSTYLSFLSTDDFAYKLKMNVDDRGSFTEIIRTAERGQFSVNVAKPGITKGNHWHHTKNEKFLVVSGKGVIRFRKPDEEKIYEYFVDGDDLTVVDIPTGYTHNIENIGDTDLVTFMWANEPFDPENPDTYFLKV